MPCRSLAFIVTVVTTSNVKHNGCIPSNLEISKPSNLPPMAPEAVQMLEAYAALNVRHRAGSRTDRCDQESSDVNQVENEDY